MRSALAFLTVLGGWRPPDRKAVLWFPAVGAAVGAGVGGAWWGGWWLWRAPAAAVAAVAADAALTGMIHLDGLVDSADGLLPHLSRQRRLQAMADPATGAFGVTVGGLALLARWAALDTLRPSVLLVASIWCASRTWMAVTMGAVPYARAGGGLGDAFAGARVVPVAAIGTAMAMAMAVAWHPLRGVVALLAGTVAAAGVVALAYRRLGGFTGDVLGAGAVVGETVALLAAAARR